MWNGHCWLGYITNNNNNNNNWKKNKMFSNPPWVVRSFPESGHLPEPWESEYTP